MHMDFFIEKCQTNNISERLFGICDDKDEGNKTPAYIDTTDQDKWIAIVKNHTNLSLNFTAVDNCIEARKEDGSMDFRCDAMLTNKDNIVFIELKDQKDNWIRHAVYEQLQTTIDNFKASHDISVYRHKRAFACNKARPRFKVNYKDMMNQFYQKNKVRLNLTTEIVFKED